MNGDNKVSPSELIPINMKPCTRKDFEEVDEAEIYDKVYGDNEKKKYLICLDYDKDKIKLKNNMDYYKEYNLM